MKGMKGVELPINVLIIVAVALIVLLGIVALFFTGWSPFPATVGLESIKNAACRELAQEFQCKISTADVEIHNFDADRDGFLGVDDTASSDDIIGWCENPAVGNMGENLFNLCRCHYNMGPLIAYSTRVLTAQETADLESSCRRMCGCP